MKPSRITTLFVVFLVLAVIANNALRKVDDTAAYSARVDTVRLRDSARAPIHDTVTKYLPRAAVAKAKSDSADTKVGIVSDSTVIVHDTVAVIPLEVIADVRALRGTVATQDTLIGVLRRQTEADSLRIVARDNVIAHPKPESPWGIGATCGVDPFNTNGPRCTFGLTYRAKIRLPFLR